MRAFSLKQRAPLFAGLAMSLFFAACGVTPHADGGTPAGMACGGAAHATCPSGYTCADLIGDSCIVDSNPDCAGLCVTGAEAACSGITGRSCPSGMTCVDNPADGCHPDNGANADCSGLCAGPAR